MQALSILWLGHSTFLLVTPGGQRVLVDPWLGNPTCPPAFSKPAALLPLDVILATCLEDDVLAWELGAEGAWAKVGTVRGVNMHERLMRQARERVETG